GGLDGGADGGAEGGGDGAVEIALGEGAGRGVAHPLASATGSTRTTRRVVLFLMPAEIIVPIVPEGPGQVKLPALGQFASPYFVLGRLQRSTYIQVRLALQAPSGLVWLATWPSA